MTTALFYGLLFGLVALLLVMVILVVVLIRRPGFVGGGLRAESWVDRQLCGWLHRGRHAFMFDRDGTQRRYCTVGGCGMLVVKRPLRARISAKARQEATAVLQGRRN